jgi:aspartyl-tRNA(Asn)/glutamyl-tRNA(Gln) amidotransferase subunit C
MAVTIEEVKRIAELARLTFAQEELETFTRQFNQILEYMEKLNELDTTNVEPLSHVIELENAFREDTVHPSHPKEDVLKNAPEEDGKYFKVPKVIGDR